ncbi:hypothetical protein BsWGS_23133 [Bradybaena similaris]
MKLILVLAFLCFIGTPTINGLLSKKVLDFLSYFTCVIDNKHQKQQPGDDHALIQARTVPVDIKCFKPNPVLFLEEGVNGVIRLFYLLVVTEGIEDTVSMDFYTIADQTNYKPREFKVESLYNMSCGAFHKVENCTASYTVADGYLYGNFPECTYSVGEKHPRFTSFYRCNSVTASMPQNTDQASPIEPYELLVTQRFPVLNAPKGYVPPCPSKVDNTTNVTNDDASSSRR